MNAKNIREMWDEADIKHQQVLEKLGINISTTAAYLAIHEILGVESVEPEDVSMEGFDTCSGGRIKSPIPSLDELNLRAKR
jgi:hypothetical protein